MVCVIFWLSSLGCINNLLTFQILSLILLKSQLLLLLQVCIDYVGHTGKVTKVVLLFVFWFFKLNPWAVGIVYNFFAWQFCCLGQQLQSHCFLEQFGTLLVMQPSRWYLLAGLAVASRGSKLAYICFRYPVSWVAVQFVFEVFEHRGVLLDILRRKLWVFFLVESFIRFFIAFFLIFSYSFYNFF